MAYGQLGSVLMSAQQSLGTLLVSSNRSIPIVSENFEHTIDQIKEATMYGRFGESPRHQGMRAVSATMEFEPQPTMLGALLYAINGRDSVTSGTGIQTHKFRPLDTADWADAAALQPYSFLVDRNTNANSVMCFFDMVADQFTLAAKNG